MTRLLLCCLVDPGELALYVEYAAGGVALKADEELSMKAVGRVVEATGAALKLEETSIGVSG